MEELVKIHFKVSLEYNIPVLSEIQRKDLSKLAYSLKECIFHTRNKRKRIEFSALKEIKTPVGMIYNRKAI